MAVYRLPINNSVQQVFDVDLGDKSYTLRFQYNKQAGAWFLDVSEQDGAALVQGLPLVSGANILDQYLYKGFGGVLVLYTDGEPDHMPNLNELGEWTSVYYVPVEVQQDA